MRALNRLEVRATFGGSSLGVVPLEDVLDGVEEWTEGTEGDQEAVTFTLNREGESWALLQHRRVLAQVFEDGTEAEWRIVQETEAQDGGTGETAATVRAEAPLLDLADTDLVSHEEVDGSVVHTFAPWGLTPAEHLTLVAPVLPPGWSIGTVESTEQVEVQYDNDNALTAAYAIAEAAGLVVDWTAAGGGAFVLHLRDPEVTDDSEAADLRYGLNVAGIELETDSTALASRLYPHGAAENGIRAGIEDAAWVVEAVDGTGTRLRFPAECIAFDGQMDGRYVELAGTATRLLVVQTVAAAREVVVATPGIQPGALIQFRATATGRHLTYLDNPATAARWPKKAAQVSYDDVPDIQNVLPGGFFDVLEGNAPRGWERVGTLTELRLEMSPLFVRHGEASTYFATTDEGAGLVSKWTPYSLSVLRWYLSLQAVLYLAEGALRMEFELENDQGEVRVFPPAGQAVWATLGWADNWGVSPGELAELEGWGTRRVRARFVNATNRPLRVYLDAAMLTPTPNGASEFSEGRAANRLWTRTLEELAEPVRTNPQLRAKVDVVDLYAADPDAFRYYELPKRGVVRVQHEPLGADFRTRIVGRKRSAVTGQVLEVELDTRILSLAGDVAGGGRRGRRGAPLRNSAQGGVDISIEQVERSAAGVKLRLTATSSTGQRVALFFRGDKDPSSKLYSRRPAASWVGSPLVYDLMVTPPDPGKSVVVVEAYAAAEGGAVSPVRSATIDASDQASFTSFTLTIDEPSGFPRVRGNVDSDTKSARLFFRIAASPPYPTDAEVEAGVVVPVTAGVVSYVHPVEVPRRQRVRVGAAPYRGPDGAGPGGVQDHGPTQLRDAERRVAAAPRIWVVELGAGAGKSNLYVTVRDPEGGGRLYAWTNPGGPDSPDPDTQAHDGHADVFASEARFTPTSDFVRADGSFAKLLRQVPYHAGRGKSVYFLYESWSGEKTEVVKVDLRNVFDEAIDELGQVRAQSVRSAMAKLEDMDAVLVLSALPADNTESSLVLLLDQNGKGKLYRWEQGAGWVPMVRAVDIDGQLIAQQLADAAVTRRAILDGAVDALKLADAAVTAAKVAAGAITVGKIGTDAVGEAQLAARAVTNAKLALAAVTSEVLAAAAVTETKIGDGAVTTPKLVAGAVTAARIAAGAVTTEKLAAAAVTAETIAAGAVYASHIGVHQILAHHIAAEQILAAHIIAGQILASHIGAEQINAGHIVGRSITADRLVAGSITADELGANSVTAEKILARSITALKIAADTITSNELAANSVTANELAANSVYAGTIQAGAVKAEAIDVGAVTAAAIAANAVTAEKIEADSVTADKIAVATLGEIADDLGIVVKGVLRSGAVRTDGTPMVELDLNATGAAEILDAMAVVIRANGTGSWRGLVEADEFMAHEAKFYSLRMRARPDLPALPRGIFFPGGGHLSDNGGSELHLASAGGVGLIAPIVETSGAFRARGAFNADTDATVAGTIAAGAVSAGGVSIQGRPAAGVIISTGDPSGGPYPAGTLWCKVS
jgi:hypothetical protein